MIHKRIRTTLALAALILFGGRLYLPGPLLSNLAMLKFTHSLLQIPASLIRSDYPLHMHLAKVGDAATSLEWFARARDLGTTPFGLWGLGRVALAVGDNSLASDGLHEAVKRGRLPEAAYRDSLLAFSLAGDHDGVIQLYEEKRPPLLTAAMSDLLALAYLEKGRALADRGEMSAAASSFRKALESRPQDLYANVRLYELAASQGDLTTSRVYQKALVSVSGSAIHPADSRLAIYALWGSERVIEDGLWDASTVRQVLAGLVWMETDVAGLEPLLRELTSKLEYQLDAYFLLGELYQRKGRWSEAEEAYQQVVIIAPQSAEPYFRLALVCQATQPTCAGSRTIGLLASYLERRPADLAALSLVENLCRQPEDIATTEACTKALAASALQSIDRLQGALAERTDAPVILAGILGTKRENLVLGADLLGITRFSVDDSPVLSRWIMSDELTRGSAFRQAPYLGGLDAIYAWEDTATVRLLSLASQTNRGRLLSSSYGAWAYDAAKAQIREITIDANKWYVVTGYYATDVHTDQITLYLNGETQAMLPGTSGEVRHFLVTYCQPSPAITKTIMLYSFLSTTVGGARIGPISIHEVGASVPVRQACRTSTYTQ